MCDRLKSGVRVCNKMNRGVCMCEETKWAVCVCGEMKRSVCVGACVCSCVSLGIRVHRANLACMCVRQLAPFCRKHAHFWLSHIIFTAHHTVFFNSTPIPHQVYFFFTRAAALSTSLHHSCARKSRVAARGANRVVYLLYNTSTSFVTAVYHVNIVTLG